MALRPGACDGQADVVAGCPVFVLGPRRLSGAGASGFGNTGRAGEVGADVPQPWSSRESFSRSEKCAPDRSGGGTPARNGPRRPGWSRSWGITTTPAEHPGPSTIIRRSRHQRPLQQVKFTVMVKPGGAVGEPGAGNWPWPVSPSGTDGPRTPPRRGRTRPGTRGRRGAGIGAYPQAAPGPPAVPLGDLLNASDFSRSRLCHLPAHVRARDVLHQAASATRQGHGARHG